MTEIDIYLIGLGLLAIAVLVLAGLLWHTSKDAERAEDERDAARTELAALRERCEQLVAELDALTSHGRPPERDLFAASVEADLAALEVAEPERPRKPKHATRLWLPFQTRYPTWPPFGIATRPDQQREA